jgi:hypothetical protein
MLIESQERANIQNEIVEARAGGCQAIEETFGQADGGDPSGARDPRRTRETVAHADGGVRGPRRTETQADGGVIDSRGTETQADGGVRGPCGTETGDWDFLEHNADAGIGVAAAAL